MYSINDNIVYKNDVSVILDIKDIKGAMYYIISPISDLSLKISVPSDSTMIRPIIESGSAIDMIENISKINVCTASNDKALEQIYKRLLLSGDLGDLLVIFKTTYLRNLNRINTGKKIGSLDKHYYDESLKKIVSELSLSLRLGAEDIEKFLIHSINK